MSSTRLKIGISACFFHPDPSRATFSKKTLLYLEQSTAHWVMSSGAFPILLPTEYKPLKYPEIISYIDGLILHGGADIDPRSYGEKPISEKWPGDMKRDRYEISLYKECRKQGKPVMGVCRGAQLINVAHGGTLYQDIPTQLPEALEHRNAEKYDNNFHEIEFKDDEVFGSIFPNIKKSHINTVHHQAIKELGQGLVATGFSPKDNVIEAFRLVETAPLDTKNGFTIGVQWHPEFMLDANPNYLSPHL